ncbi:MAG: MFS transporter [Rhodospirillaceae bacterium]|nr:MFS transporter [Rhodospirillaceae bacterium]HAA91208.1 MFS transporter [Rhodospirillaceae bacterium]
MTSASVDERGAEEYSPTERWIITIVAMSGMFCMFISATIVNVAIPSIMGAFGVGQDQAQWVATAYLATMVASQLLSHWFVRAFGTRLSYVIIIGIWMFGTLVCSTTTTLDFLVLGRVLQGMGAGVMQPLVMVLVFQVYPADKRGFGMGLYGMVATLAPTFGPLLGGYVIDYFSWRSIFVAPLPLAIIGMILGPLFIPGDRPRGPLPRFDWSSYILLCTTLICWISVLSNGQRWGWESNTMLYTILIGLIAGIWFVRIQLQAPVPMLDFSLFRHGRFTAAVAVSFVFGMGNFASSYMVPVFAQVVQGFTPSNAGLVMMPAGILLSAALPFTGRLSDHVPAHIMVMTGITLFAAGAFLMSGADVNTSFFSLMIFIVISRFGLAFILPSLTTAAFDALDPEELNQGSGALNFLRQLGGASGISILVLTMEHRAQFHGENLTATQTPANSVSRELLGAVSNLMSQHGLPDSLHAAGALHYLGEIVYAQAYTLGFKDGFLVLAFVFLMALIPAYAMRERVKAQIG